MCEAVIYSTKIQELFIEAEEKSQCFAKKLSNLDLQEQDVLHFIEQGNFNAYQGFMYSKKT